MALLIPLLTYSWPTPGENLFNSTNWLSPAWATDLQVPSGGFINVVTLSTTALAVALWRGPSITVGNDQYGQIVILHEAVNATNDAGILLRSRLDATETFYIGDVFNGTVRILKCIAGTFTSLASGSYTVADNDVLLFTVLGTTLTLFINGVQKLTASDAAIASGNVGPVMNDSARLSSLGTFVMGNVVNQTGGTKDANSFGGSLTRVSSRGGLVFKTNSFRTTTSGGRITR